MFELQKSKEILAKTPSILVPMLTGLSEEWLMNNEGVNTWSPYDVVGHLISAEKTNWIPRIKIILSASDNKSFDPFDRFAQMKSKKEKTIEELLIEFRNLRENSLNILDDMNIQESDLSKIGVHPEFGEVNLKQQLSTWVVHDLGHISQITRVMAKQYKDDVGPWISYLSILRN